MRTRLFTILALCTLIVPIAVAASIAPPEYRECMRAAIDAREQGHIDSLRQFNDEHEQALDERRVLYVESYDSETDKEIRERQRDANREYGRRHADIKRDKRDRDRDITQTYNDAKRECRDLRRSIERPPRVVRHPTFGQDCGERVCLR